MRRLNAGPWELRIPDERWNRQVARDFPDPCALSAELAEEHRE